MVKTVDYILKFHEDFYHPIKEELKISTTRRTSKPINIGDFVIATFEPSDKLLILRIDGHYAKKLKDLSRNDAVNEGYYHANLLKHELRMIYPEICDDDYVYIYQFTAIRDRAKTPLREFEANYMLNNGVWMVKQ